MTKEEALKALGNETQALKIKIVKLQARLDAAEKVCEMASLEYSEYCNNNECTVCKALDEWRRVKEG